MGRGLTFQSVYHRNSLIQGACSPVSRHTDSPENILPYAEKAVLFSSHLHSLQAGTHRVPSWYLAVSAYCSVGLKHVILGLLGDELCLLKFTANF